MTFEESIEAVKNSEIPFALVCGGELLELHSNVEVAHAAVLLQTMAARLLELDTSNERLLEIVLRVISGEVNFVLVCGGDQPSYVSNVSVEDSITALRGVADELENRQ